MSLVRKIRTALWALLFSSTFGGAFAAGPDWWSDTPTKVFDPGLVENNLAPANIGQLKHVAKMAKRYLDLQFASMGGAGPAVNALVGSFQTQAAQGLSAEEWRAQNYAPLNIGQLKAVGKVFYDRLRQLGFETRLIPSLHGDTTAGGWQYPYPWSPRTLTTPPGLNYAVANLGQLKMVFSFDVTLSSDPDGDGLSTADEFLMGTNPFSADSDGDGIADNAEISAGGNPLQNSVSNVKLSAFVFVIP